MKRSIKYRVGEYDRRRLCATNNDLHQHLMQSLAKRLKMRFVVTWYDPRREFTAFIAKLAGGAAPETCKIDSVEVSGKSTSLCVMQESFVEEKMVAGDYDWSHMAMDLWPERVIPKCVENASYAIAHELDEVFWTQDDRDRFQAKPKPEGGWQPIIDKLVAERQRAGVAEAREKLIADGAKAAPKKRRGRSRTS